MTAREGIREIDRTRLVPVVVIDDASDAAEVAKALLAGGIICAEFTLRTPTAVDAIAAAAKVPGFTVGAGTVLTAEQVDKCVDAGAQFIVSPGIDDEVIARAAERAVPAIPGVATATEIQRAMNLGLSRLKLFPAGPLGGPDILSAYAGPFPNVSFLPSGGISAGNAGTYLGAPNVFAISGSWMVRPDLIRARDFGEIERLSTQAAKLVLQ
ncbi:bifunctional 4-hydroxy-2-oxoglutarate aldolase/2-dehydro-3-deoxy-phosphogluconate aldolase [Pseudarthrobacter sp. alpha12b]